jgi:hypothetical protein
MATADTELGTCAGCGATIYPEHLERHSADRVGGKLFCMHCLAEQRATVGGGTVGEGGMAIPLLDDAAPEAAQSAVSTVRERAAHSHGPKFRRPLLTGSPAATRCRTFHCKLTDASIVHMDQQINEWIDGHDDVEVKFATSTVGVVEGKHNDPHLIVTIYY